ncbi:hypothetical protein, partial [Pseudoalteromonas sp. BMB]|uniref:hypothetical protein n=1 Tax=Pseudoalteromonas sp. BMB TaxID=1874619 RepID=UPI001C309703
MCNVTMVPGHKRHNSSISNRSWQTITVAAGLPRNLRFSHQLILYKQAFALQTHRRDIKSLLRKHIPVRHQITANN